MKMKSATFALAGSAMAAAMALAAPAASAAEVGMGVDMTGALNGAATVYIPIKLEGFRIEPEIGYSSASSTSTTGGVATSTSSKTTSVGVGVFVVSEVNQSLELYYGLRLGQVYTAATTAGGVASNNTGNFFAPTIGTEYYFNKQFAVGLTVSLTRTSNSGHDNNGATSTSGTSLNTETHAALYYYF